MAGPGNTELQLPKGATPEREGFKHEDEQVIDYVKRALQVTKERFFDTGQSATLALSDAQSVPGYVSLVAVTNPEQDMEVVVSLYDGFSATGGVIGEDIGGQEIHISYRQLRGNRAVPKPIRKRMSGYEHGVIVLPSEGTKNHWINKPYSSKSTMRPSDVKMWEDGDTTPHVSIGNFPGQRRLQPTKADYEAILDTVARGTKNEVLTRNSIQNVPRINLGHKFEEKKFTDAQADIVSRNEEIMRGEALAVESAEQARLLLEQADAIEADHANEQSFSIGEQRLKELALQFSGQDAMIIDHAANQLASMGASINMVRTLLESDDPRVKEALKNETRDRTEVKLTPAEMYLLTNYIASNWEFATMKENTGFIDGVIYGVGLDHMRIPSANKEGEVNMVEASQEAKIRILEALEFLRSGETLTQKIDRIGGLPVYQQTKSGEKTSMVHTFRQNPRTGESIIWNPYYITPGQHSNIRITSPLFGPFFIAMVDTDLQITNNGQQDRLEPTTGKIDYITCRFEGGRDNKDDIGSAMFRLSKNISGGSNFLKLVEG